MSVQQQREEPPPPKLFRGIIPALVTPFDNQGNLDTHAVGPLVEHLIQQGVHGFYVCGSTGEGMHMSIQERKSMLEHVVLAAQRRVPIMVMVGACSLEDATSLARHAETCGADAISSVCPGAYKWLGEPKPDLDWCIAYFSAVASATTPPFF